MTPARDALISAKAAATAAEELHRDLESRRAKFESESSALEKRTSALTSELGELAADADSSEALTAKRAEIDRVGRDLAEKKAAVDVLIRRIDMAKEAKRCREADLRAVEALVAEPFAKAKRAEAKEAFRAFVRLQIEWLGLACTAGLPYTGVATTHADANEWAPPGGIAKGSLHEMCREMGLRFDTFGRTCDSQSLTDVHQDENAKLVADDLLALDLTDVTIKSPQPTRPKAATPAPKPKPAPLQPTRRPTHGWNDAGTCGVDSRGNYFEAP